MLKKYMALITNQGMDAAIPLANKSPVELRKKMYAKAKQDVEKLYSNYAKTIFYALWETGKTISIDEKGYVRIDGYMIKDLSNEIDTIYKEVDNAFVKATMDDGAANPHAYSMFHLRAQVAGDVKLKAIFAIDENDFKILRNIDSEMAAFYILDGMIRETTDFGRFGEQKKKRVFMLNKMIEDNKSKLKSLRREFFNRITSVGEEDDDDII